MKLPSTEFYLTITNPDSPLKKTFCSICWHKMISWFNRKWFGKYPRGKDLAGKIGGEKTGGDKIGGEKTVGEKTGHRAPGSYFMRSITEANEKSTVLHDSTLTLAARCEGYYAQPVGLQRIFFGISLQSQWLVNHWGRSCLVVLELLFQKNNIIHNMMFGGAIFWYCVY